MITFMGGPAFGETGSCRLPAVSGDGSAEIRRIRDGVPRFGGDPADRRDAFRERRGTGIRCRVVLIRTVNRHEPIPSVRMHSQ